MEIEEVIALISYWQAIQDIQSAFLNPNVTARLEDTLNALQAYLEILQKAG